MQCRSLIAGSGATGEGESADGSVWGAGEQPAGPPLASHPSRLPALLQAVPAHHLPCILHRLHCQQEQVESRPWQEPSPYTHPGTLQYCAEIPPIQTGGGFKKDR